MNASRRLCSLLMFLAAGGIEAADYRIDTTDSLVAVVTHKAGVAAGLAHDHLIVLGELPAQLEFDPDAPLETRLQFSSAVESLQVDPWARQQEIYPRLEQLGVFNVQDVARFSSGLQFDQGVLPTDTRPVIRGAISLRGRPNTGILVDFVVVSSRASASSRGSPRITAACSSGTMPQTSA